MIFIYDVYRKTYIYTYIYIMTVCIHIFHIFSIVCKVIDNFIFVNLK